MSFLHVSTLQALLDNFVLSPFGQVFGAVHACLGKSRGAFAQTEVPEKRVELGIRS